MRNITKKRDPYFPDWKKDGDKLLRNNKEVITTACRFAIPIFKRDYIALAIYLI